MRDAAVRIFNDKKLSERNETGDVSSIDEVERSLRERMRSDDLRYKKYYNLDVYDTSQYDFVLDTTGVSLGGVYDQVVSYLKSRRLLTSD
jgi:cytidylate kinase